MNNKNNKLASITSFEEYEELKLTSEVFEDTIHEILTLHQL